jgi:hypothetical protein
MVHFRGRRGSRLRQTFESWRRFPTDWTHTSLAHTNRRFHHSQARRSPSSEGVGASIVKGMDAPPAFEPAEHIFDSVPLAIEDAVMFDRFSSVGFWRNASCSASLGKSRSASYKKVMTLSCATRRGFAHPAAGIDHRRARRAAHPDRPRPPRRLTGPPP